MVAEFVRLILGGGAEVGHAVIFAVIAGADVAGAIDRGGNPGLKTPFAAALGFGSPESGAGPAAPAGTLDDCEPVHLILPGESFHVSPFLGIVIEINILQLHKGRTPMAAAARRDHFFQVCQNQVQIAPDPITAIRLLGKRLNKSRRCRRLEMSIVDLALISPVYNRYIDYLYFALVNN